MNALAIEVAARSGEAAKSGPIGLAVILILCLVCYFLFKSMSKHLRTVRDQQAAAEQAMRERRDRTGTLGRPTSEQPPPSAQVPGPHAADDPPHRPSS